MPPILDWKEKSKKKEKKRKENIPEETTTTGEITSGWERKYSCKPIKKPPYIPLKYKDTTGHEPITITSPAIGNDMATQKDKASGTTNHVSLAANNYSMKECGTTFLVKEKHMTLCANIRFSSATKEEQKQCLKEINTRLCDHCLIPCDFQFCDDCDLIYNPPPHMIYTIPEEEEPINNCTSELESSSNPDSNFDNNNNKNNGSSSVQNGYNNDNNSNSDSNYEQYIALSDLTKKQELKWFSDNDKGIMPECVHNTDTEFDLRYSEKNTIKLESHLHTCIDLKIVLEILATTMVQLASRSSLAKKGINIRGGIIDAGYVKNIIAMLQNNSEKTYVIEPNERIAQTIFLSLVKIAQLVSMGNKKELGITARGIQGFESMGRIDVPVNMVEEEIIGQGKIISTG
ncbi:hypothetical protein G9A89_021921 [Geosiphon pyriformis]|nr:hypothetical protein G9A89_021921 [Geosiphon pyriformis]